MPQAPQGWSEGAVRYGLPREENSCGESSCYGSTVVGDAWVAVEAHGGGALAMDEAGWQPVFDAVIEAVRAAGPAAPPAFSLETTPPTAEYCDTVIPRDVVQSLTSVPDVFPRRRGGGAWSEWAEAMAQAGNIGCSWTVGDSDVSVLYVEWVHDGRWAFERMLRGAVTTPVELAGLSAGDVAVVRCQEEFNSDCAVDIALGQDWFNVAASGRDTAIALAEALLAQHEQ